MNVRIVAPLAAAALALGVQAAAVIGTGSQPASAEGVTGMSGYLLEAGTKTPIKGATIIVARHENDPVRVKELKTDEHGFFADLTLTPGPYLVTTNVHEQITTCFVDNIQEGVVRTMRIIVGQPGTTPQCLGALVRVGTVDPDQTASLYRI